MQPQKQKNGLGSFAKQAIQHQSDPIYAHTTHAKEAEAEWFYKDIKDLLELTHTKKRDVLFIIGYWNAKVGSQQILRVANRFGLGVQNEARQRLTQFCLLYKHHLSTTQEMTLHMDMIRW